MAKNIILLSDGTGNSAAKLFKTNVWRLYQALDLSSPSEPGQPRQIAYYDDGVGTSSFKPLALLGGAFGWGLKRNVLDLYTFLCRNYEPGDRIYCFGFSRGAFTIRVLIGLVARQGLVYAESEAELRRLATWAFREYRQRYQGTAIHLRVTRRMRDSVAGCKAVFRYEEQDRFAGCREAILRDPRGYQTKQMQKYKKELTLTGESGKIFTFVGLWDTVAAYGLPFKELTRAWHWVFPLSVPDRNLSETVARACHALALDDERETFHPVLWNEQKLPEGQTITQVWFAGMHSNVGGGYADDALSYVSLNWIMSEAAAGPEPLMFKPRAWEEIHDKADICGKIYDSRHGLGGTYRYWPRKIKALTNDTADPNNQVVITCPKIHESVFQRINQGVDSYAPIGLPEEYAVAKADGSVMNMGEDNLARSENSEQAKARWDQQDSKVWNLVRRKRRVYFISVFVAVALALFPLCFPATPAGEASGGVLSWFFKGISLFLPDFVSYWLNAYQSHPGAFGLLVVLLSAFIYLGSRLQIRIFDNMRKIWKDILMSARVEGR